MIGFRVCPRCGAKVQESEQSLLHLGPSQPGDFTVCPRCCAFLSLNEDLSFRLLTLKDLPEIPAAVLECYEALGFEIALVTTMVAPLNLK